ncbi:MAG: hypothetical protein SGJ11_00735 [Phycisphaerae bacterium]|nr:hypothetical protein [Phycisphaerae bacterium]
MIHEYDTIDASIVWTMVIEYIPPLVAERERALEAWPALRTRDGRLRDRRKVPRRRRIGPPGRGSVSTKAVRADRARTKPGSDYSGSISRSST